MSGAAPELATCSQFFLMSAVDLSYGLAIRCCSPEKIVPVLAMSSVPCFFFSSTISFVILGCLRRGYVVECRACGLVSRRKYTETFSCPSVPSRVRSGSQAAGQTWADSNNLLFRKKKPALPSNGDQTEGS
ncbi:unnamed protein product [Ixodes persulcatus]